jgi:hypothetical protein
VRVAVGLRPHRAVLQLDRPAAVALPVGASRHRGDLLQLGGLVVALEEAERGQAEAERLALDRGDALLVDDDDLARGQEPAELADGLVVAGGARGNLGRRAAVQQPLHRARQWRARRRRQGAPTPSSPTVAAPAIAAVVRKENT